MSVLLIMEVASIFVETPSELTIVHANKDSYCTKTTTIARKEAARYDYTYVVTPTLISIHEIFKKRVLYNLYMLLE